MAATDEKTRLKHLGDMEVEAVVELGRKKMKLKRVRQLRKQDIIELDQLAGEAFSIRINDAPFAKGEVIIVGESIACRLTRMMESHVEESEEGDKDLRGDGA